MKESKFIEQNKEKWEKLEGMIQSENSDPNILSDLFIQLTDDLSYSRTFYQNRTVRAYLNNLARRIFEKIYINRKAKRKNIVKFWKEDLPSIIYLSRYELLTSLIVFVVSMAIGIFSSIIDPDFSKLILGEQYVEMTMENIDSGDPMAVYKKMNQIDMFLGITWNNILVAFRTFIFGIFLSLGTLLILIYNGIMVGTFQYFFIEKDLFFESFLTIWIHGTIEISSIVIAGGAGIVFGKGLLFPGTLTRLQSFQESAVRALKIFIGIVPIFILAGLLESFVTRYTDVPTILRASIILLSASFIVYYFVILPFRVKGRVTKADIPDTNTLKEIKGENELAGQILNVSNILNYTFIFYRRKIKKFALPILLLSIVYPLIFVNFLAGELVVEIDSEAGLLGSFALLFDYNAFPILIVPNTLLIAFVLFTFSQQRSGQNDLGKWTSRNKLPAFISVLLITLLPSLILLLEFRILALIILLCALPYSLNWMAVATKSKFGVFSSLSRSFSLLNSSSGRLWSCYLATLILAFIGFVFLNSPVFMSSSEILTWNMPFEYETVTLIVEGFSFWLSAVLVILLLPFVYLSISINYYTAEEINSANGLKQQVAEF